MRLKEQRVFDTLKRHCPADIWVQRIENMIGVGMPDNVLLVKGGHQCWLELKAPTAPKRFTTPLLGNKEGLNKDQINWHTKCAAQGVLSWVLIRDTDLRLFLVSGGFAPTLNLMTVEQLLEVAVATRWPGVIRGLRNFP
jgi:hypothetical protein